LKIHVKIHTRTELHNIYQRLLSRTAHFFAIICYLVTSFYPKYGSPSGHYTRTWIYTATTYRNL